MRLKHLIDREDLAVGDLRLAEPRHPAARVLKRQDDRPFHVTLGALELVPAQTAPRDHVHLGAQQVDDLVRPGRRGARVRDHTPVSVYCE